MMAKTHQAFAVFSVLVVSKYAPGSFDNIVLACGLSMFGALLPDLDSPQSSFGRLIPLLSKPLHSMLGHRTITHSLLAVILLYSVLTSSPQWHSWADAICIGYFSHIVGDMLIGTNGVALFWPLKQKISLNPLRMQVAGAGEYLAFNLLICAIVVQGLTHFYPSLDLMSRAGPIFNICVDLYTKTILPAFTSLTFKYSSLFNGL